MTFPYVYITYFDHIHPSSPCLVPLNWSPSSQIVLLLSCLSLFFNLDSTYERKLVISIFLSLAYFT
jgi:hypothetical protein